MQPPKIPIDGQQQEGALRSDGTHEGKPDNIEAIPSATRQLANRLLVVEDDAGLLQLIERFFTLNGIQVEPAITGREALEKLSAHSYDMVFTDLHLPVMDGLSLLEWIKKSHPGTKVVIMSGDNTPENIIRAMRLGALDYILKPFRLPDLLEVVERCSKKIEPANQAVLVSLVKQLIQEVRGDLLNLSMMARLLGRGHYGALEASVEEQIGTIGEKMRSMTAVVEDYCKIATVLSQGRLLSEEQLDLSEDIIQPVLNELSLELCRKEIKVVNNLDMAKLEHSLVKGNRMLLGSAVRSLFKAVVRHCNEEGCISFGISYNGRRFMINVCNEGLPLPENQRGCLFDDAFFPVGFAGAQEEYDDLGSGLFLARNIVRRHGGELWYEAMDNGSKFILTLPANC